MIELNVNQSDFSIFRQFDRVYNSFNSIDKLLDANIVRQNIRSLSKISPFANDGKKIKDSFIDRLEELIRLGLETNLKALRNIEWSAFNNGEIRVKKILSDFIILEFKKSDQTNIKLISELLEISFSDEKKNWWHNTILKTFKKLFLNCNKIIVDNLWKLINYSDKYLNNLFSLISITGEIEILLGDDIPTNTQEKTIKLLEVISKNRKWYLLHANLLHSYMSIDRALITQLRVENALSFDKSVGVKYLAEKLSEKELITLTLSTCDKKLIQISVTSILKNKLILENLDLTIPCWLTIWSTVLEDTKNISDGNNGREQEILYTVLDLIIENKQVPEIIVELYSNSIYCDISQYSKRDKCWEKLPPKFVAPFINKTAIELCRKFIIGDVELDSIENPLQDKISSDEFMTKFLSENRTNIEAVIKVYEIFPSLKDSYLSDYITYYNDSITEKQSIRIGTLVSKKYFRKTARSLYEKSKYNSSFRIAVEYCRDLVNFYWWEESWIFNKRRSHHIYDSIKYKQEENSKINMIKSLPIVVILTAIQEEYSAVRNHLKDIEEADHNDTSYEMGLFDFNGDSIAKVIIRECGAKNANASQETERAIQIFKPDCMFFVGIAGSRKPNDFSVGDVIFPEKTYSYEGGKAEKDSFKSRPDLANTNFALIELAKKERRKEDWKVLIKNKWNKDVKADLGIIASGDQIVEHYDSGIGKILTEHFNDTSVVEMEGFGFAKAANRQGRETSGILIGIVRGISDIIGQSHQKSETDGSDKRPDNVKKFASDTAAAFAFWLIFKTYEKK